MWGNYSNRRGLAIVKSTEALKQALMSTAKVRKPANQDASSGV